MDRSNNLPLFEVVFSGLYFNSLDLIEQSYRLYESEQPTFRGIPVQKIASSFPAYTSESAINQNNAGTFNPLHEYGAAYLSDAYLEAYLGG
ncbi:hypothetical protein [Salinisphaera sp. G21_0]|uniref:hypothetical protein n=1 Tax=Salinisphaera sp. G21_0 TaxID=2821094 RepID=UPI001AD9E065|nr:hypothetical protein [Salinisphaera sp. G21_0]MBO9483700.1 hypothetical protein [Salinisphaera sp. G21_0]